MKILIITDSHGNMGKIYDIIEEEKPNGIIWTGDHSWDGEECSFAFPDIQFYIVRGNCDVFDRKFNDNEILDINGIKIFITHGHLYNVKKDLFALEAMAEKYKVDAVCFGHTHIPYYSEKNGIKYFNPGALKDNRYGVLIIRNKELTFKYKEIK
ncbi:MULTISPECIES: metallophosphoesterase family protein [Cetobacterium]|jgi:putative phosphoesterase|uniref:Phosphoesterase n=1 Tax=Candidatus Cetobacterium colombiensis TaxID=3073100 RepID=A0ABU4WC21_9FUSO|nr:metallophosphoesterase [Candidatus Cetobacterium colombiensis]MDX8337066.1 metallophosphoesterase [Candidatus Cetobacterium colombiensis]